jgi:hypothetical protein
MNLRRLPDIPLSELEPGLRRVEERLQNVKVSEIQAIGSYVKSVDPEMISRLRADGYRTNAKAVGLYLYEVDADYFADLLVD